MKEKEKEKKPKKFWIYLVIILLIVAGAIAGVYLLKEDKTNNNSSNGKPNSGAQNNLVVEEDVEEITDDSIYVRKTFVDNGKQAKVEYKYENSMYAIKINNKKVKNKELTNGGAYQIEQIKDAIIIAIETPDDIGKLSIFAFDFTGKQILTIDDYVDAKNYLSLRTYGDSDKFDNWAFQITDATLKVLTGRVDAGDIDGISDPCNNSEIKKAKFTDDTITAAQHSITYLGKSKFSDAKIERVNIDYAQYKTVFPCR